MAAGCNLLETAASRSPNTLALSDDQQLTNGNDIPLRHRVASSDHLSCLIPLKSQTKLREDTFRVVVTIHGQAQ